MFDIYSSLITLAAAAAWLWWRKPTLLAEAFGVTRSDNASKDYVSPYTDSVNATELRRIVREELAGRPARKDPPSEPTIERLADGSFRVVPPQAASTIEPAAPIEAKAAATKKRN